MIGIDPRTGRTIDAWEQFVSRVAQVMTTPIGGREKRRDFGCRIPETLAKNTGDDLLLLAQSYAIESFYNPANGLEDFTPSRCVASRHASGIRLRFEGTWRHQQTTFEVTA